jgi:predicted esterase
MHGRGAPKDDLQSLADELSQAAPGTRFILPAGPHPLGRGRTWYPHFTESTQEAVDRHLLQLRAQARGVVMDIVRDLRAQGIPDERIYVGGFSQGATVALDVVLSPEGSQLGGLISLSGGALELDFAPLKRRALLHAFVSHGRSDPVINNRFSQSLVAALKQGGHEVQLVEFDDGHAIPATVRHALGLFLHAH